MRPTPSMERKSISRSLASAMTHMAAVSSTVRAKNSPLFSRVGPMISSEVQAKSTVTSPTKMNSTRK